VPNETPGEAEARGNSLPGRTLCQGIAEPPESRRQAARGAQAQHVEVLAAGLGALGVGEPAAR
jgi:hypothetical protein